MKIILIFLLVSNFAFAMDFIKGEGRFRSEDGDGHEFVKSQLIYEGFKNILSKEMDSLGLNKDLFWQKYNEKLDSRYTQVENKLKAALKINENSSSKERKNFQKILRRKKLRLKEKFGKIQSTISRFAIKKISRSTKYPKSRYIRLEGSVNSSALNKLYYRFVSGNKKSEYGKLYLNLDYELQGTTFSELGVKNEKEFVEVLSDKWIEWLEKNKPQNIGEIEHLSKSRKESLLSFQKMNSEEMLKNAPKDFVNSLLLDIQVKVTREKFDKRKNQYVFKYAGAAYLRDLQSNLIVYTHEFSQEQKEYDMDPEVYLANIIVNHIYNMTIGSFPQIVSSLKRIGTVTSVERLHIQNYPNMRTVLGFIDLVESRGIRYGVKAHIESLSVNRAEVIIYFNGEKSDIKSLLSKLQSAKRSLKYALVDESSTLGIKFN